MAISNQSLGDKNNPLSPKITSLLREAWWLVLAIAGVYLAMILITYHPDDPAWSHSGTHLSTQNAGGSLGAYVSDALLYLFGVSAWWWLGLALFVTAGSGITPVMSMLRDLKARQYQGDVVFLHVCRAPDDLIEMPAQRTEQPLAR